MNLYFNFLGAWAEAFSDDEAKKRFMETFRRVDGDRAKSEDEKEREVRREVERYAGTKAGEAQERLAHLSADHEARIYFIEERGVKAFHLKKILQNFPKELSNYRADFQDEVKGASDDKYFDLSDIFGKCMFTQGVSAEDILWSRSWVAALSGSISAETMALWMLDFTGETDVLNGCWKRYMRDNRTMEYYHGWQGDAYRPSDYQKLIRMEARRRDEAKKLYPHGYDANLGKLPEESGRGWFENAKIETVGENRAEGEERRQTVKDMLRGLRRDKMGRVVRVCEPRPFHQIDWDQLPRDTYTLDFLIPNLRYGQVFRNFMKELEFPKDFTFDSLRATNKALELSFGKKDDFVERVGEIYPEDKWVRKSPWVWYVIGAISLHNPWGQKLLEGMRTPPTLVELWLRNVSSTQKTEGRYVPTYEELVR